MEAKNRERLLIIITVSCIALLAADKLVIGPLGEVWKSRSKKIATLEDKLTNGALLVERKDDWNKRWKEMKEEGLPADESVAQDMVLRAVSRWVQDSRLSVRSLAPEWLKEKKGKSEFHEIRVQASAQGRMDSIARFLYEIERDPLPLKIEDMTITSRDNLGRELSLNVSFIGLARMDKK